MAATELEQPSMAGYDVTEGRYKVNSEKQKTSFPTLRTILGESTVKNRKKVWIISNPQNYPWRVPGPSEGCPQPPLR